MPDDVKISISSHLLIESRSLQTWGLRRPTASRARYALPRLRLLPIWLDGDEFRPRRAVK